MRLATAPLLVIAVALAACGGPAAPPPPPPVPVFDARSGYARISDEILDWYLARHPAHATAIGEHAWDTTLGSYFPGDLERGKRDARAFLTRLAAVNRPTLERADYFDHRLIEYALRAELLDLEEIGGWQRDPLRYVTRLGDGVLALYAGDGLAPDARLGAVAARLEDASPLFSAARQNLDAARVPRLFAELAIDSARVLSRRLSTGDQPPGASAASSAARARWEAARGRAIAAVDSFAAWLEQSLAPRAAGAHRLGTARLEAVLRYRHHVDIPADRLAELNIRAVEEYREWMARVAMELDPLQHADEIIEALLVAEPATLVLGEMEAPRAASRVRRVLPPPGLEDAVAHFADQASIENEAIGGADRILTLRRALHAHALLHAMYQLHAGEGGTVDQAAADIGGIGLVPAQLAREEAERIAYDPGYALLPIDRMRLFVLRERVRNQQTADALDQGAFVGEVLRVRLPLTLAAEAMLGYDPGHLIERGQRTPGVPEPPGILD